MARALSFAIVCLAALTACGSSDLNHPEAVGFPLDLPAGFPMPAVPDDNPMSGPKALLGRYLFYDTRLSSNGTYACASCHQQSHGFASPSVHAYGCTGQEHRRNAMSLTNVAYNAAFTWANPNLRTLEQQILVPMYGDTPVELGLADQDDAVVARLSSDARYPGMFGAAYPGDAHPVTMLHVQQAIATFERTLISSHSAYDRYLAGDTTAMSASALNGKELFFGERLECYHCHGGFNFSDATTHAGQAFDELTFHDTGLYNLGGTGAYPANDPGLIELTNVASDMGRFRAPTLRNLEWTAPYFHDGSAATLDDVIAHYAAGGRTIPSGPDAGNGSTNPFKDGLVRGFTLTDQEHADVIAFLQSLGDPGFVTSTAFSNPFIHPLTGVDPIACPADAPPACPTTVPSFSGQIQAIVQTRCATCHTMGASAGRWTLGSYADVSMLQSPMLSRLTACDMPPSGTTPLLRSERQAILTWLVCGAPDN